MRHRPTEVKAVVALLERDWDDVEALAQALLDELVELKWSRGGWVLMLHDRALPTPLLYGPYATANQARKDVGKRVVAASVEGAKAYTFKVHNLDAREAPPAEVLSEGEGSLGV